MGDKNYRVDATLHKWNYRPPIIFFNPSSANPTEWLHKLKQFVGKLPTNCFSVFDHFMRSAVIGLIETVLLPIYINEKNSFFTPSHEGKIESRFLSTKSTLEKIETNANIDTKN